MLQKRPDQNISKGWISTYGKDLLKDVTERKSYCYLLVCDQPSTGQIQVISRIRYYGQFRQHLTRIGLCQIDTSCRVY